MSAEYSLKYIWDISILDKENQTFQDGDTKKISVQGAEKVERADSEAEGDRNPIMSFSMASGF